MRVNKISAIVIAKNEEEKIEACLDSLRWADELILVDTGSNDRTIDIAKKKGCNIYHYQKGSYSAWRNYGRDKSKYDYLLYLDSDERVDSYLREEIEKKLENWPANVACYGIPRKNIVFGKTLMHGGWYPDYVVRLFKKDKLVKWAGDLHEQPDYKGNLEYLNSPIIHYKENSLSEMVQKTNKWSEIEADLMFKADHPPMNLLRFCSACFREFYFRFIKNLAFLDGGEGIIFGIYQIYSRFISYAKLWELQIKSDKKN